MRGNQPESTRFAGGDPRKLPVDDAWLPATVVFGWMAFKDSLRTTQILAELIEEIRGKAHLPQETWLDGNPSLKGKIALLEQSRDWIVEKIRAEKLHAYIRTIDPEMRCVPSHDFIGRLTIHPLRGELTSLYSDDDKAHQEASLVVQARKRSGLTGEVWFSRDELLGLRADTPQAWTPISGCPVGADDSRTRPAPSRPGEVKPPFSKTGAHVLLAARKVSDWRVPPTEDESGRFLAMNYSSVPREAHREIRRELWPGQIKRGPRAKRNRLS